MGGYEDIHIMSAKTDPYIRCRSGKRFHILNPVAREMDIADICHALSVMPRFNGHTQVPYYIAQHVSLCCDQAPPEHKRAALGHDFAETWTSDLISQIKSLLPRYRVIEERIEAVVASKYGFQFPYDPLIKEIDLTLLATEMRDLMSVSDHRSLPYLPLPIHIVPWTSARCRREFLKRYHRLYP